jgi:ribosomal protein L9
MYISLLSVFNFLLRKLLAKSREEDHKSRNEAEQARKERQAEQVKEDIADNYRRH